MNSIVTKRSALIVATSSSFLTPFMGSSINIALPSIQKEFHLDAIMVSWIATSYLLAVAVSLVPFGRLADIYGRKKIFAYGILVYTVSSVLCGISISIPEGYEAQVRPRSGLALNHSVGIINAPGTVDSDYRGEIMVLLTNFADHKFLLQRGDRIAQLVLAKCEKIEWEVVEELDPTDRGGGGFGHSGR